MYIRALCLLMFTILVGCGNKTSETLQKFSNQEVVLWTSLSNKHAPNSELDCSKVIQNTDGLLSFTYVSKDSYVQLLYWGKQTDPQKITSYPIKVDVAKGDLTSFEILNKSLDSKLNFSLKRDDSALVNFLYSDAGSSVIQFDGWSYSAPTASQVAQFERDKKFMKPVLNNICSYTSLQNFMINSDPAKLEYVSAEIDNFEGFIEKKKLVESSSDCKKDQGNYLTINSMFGEVSYQNNKSTLQTVNLKNEYSNITKNSLTFTTKVFAEKNDPLLKQLDADELLITEVVGNIKMIDSNHISIAKKSVQLEPTSSTKGALKYSSKDESVKYFLCDF